MRYFRTEYFPDRTRIGIVTVRGDLCRCAVHDRLSAAEEALGCIHVPGRAEHRIYQITFTVDSPLQVTPLALHLQVRLVHVPPSAHFSFAFATDVLGQLRSKPLLPIPYGLVRELEAAEEKHLRQIPQAQLVPQSAEDDLENDIGGEPEVVERRARTLVELRRHPTHRNAV
jgi:hypothetical protein